MTPQAHCDGNRCVADLPARMTSKRVVNDNTTEQTWCTVADETGDTNVYFPKTAPVTVFQRICYVFRDTDPTIADDKTVRVLSWIGSANQIRTSQAVPGGDIDLEMRHEFLDDVSFTHLLTTNPILQTGRKCGAVSYPINGRQGFGHSTPRILVHVADHGWLHITWWNLGSC